MKDTQKGWPFAVAYFSLRERPPTRLARVGYICKSASIVVALKGGKAECGGVGWKEAARRAI